MPKFQYNIWLFGTRRPLFRTGCRKITPLKCTFQPASAAPLEHIRTGRWHCKSGNSRSTVNNGHRKGEKTNCTLWVFRRKNEHAKGYWTEWKSTKILTTHSVASRENFWSFSALLQSKPNIYCNLFIDISQDYRHFLPLNHQKTWQKAEKLGYGKGKRPDFSGRNIRTFGVKHRNFASKKSVLSAFPTGKRRKTQAKQGKNRKCSYFAIFRDGTRRSGFRAPSRVDNGTP